MSMTKELIDRLRTNANWLDEEDNDERAIRKSMLEAADTIQLLSEKLHASQMEPCEDCISRQAVLEQTYNWSKDEFLRVTNPFDYLRKRINSLPSVNPQKPKMGHWIYICNSKVNGLKIVKCSECGKRTYGSGKYCPNCGAKMEGGE